MVIDTFAKFAGLEGDAENDAGAVGRALDPLQDAAGDDMTFIIIHHERISGGSVVDAGRGSSNLPGGVDQILSIRRSDDMGRNVRKIQAEGRFEGETPDKSYITLDNGEYQLHSRDAATNAQHGTVTSVLPIAPEKGLSVKQVKEALDNTIDKAPSERTIRRNLEELHETNDVIKVEGSTRNGGDRYSLPQRGHVNNEDGINVDLG